MKRCIYCNQPVIDRDHGHRSRWDWEAIAQEGHANNCVWVRTKGETGMPMEKQKMLIEAR